MGGEEIDPVDVPITAQSIRDAVAKLHAISAVAQYNAMDAMIGSYFNTKFIESLELRHTPVMPAWVQNLEREWRL